MRLEKLDLHNEKLYNSLSSPNVVGTIKSRRAKQVARHETLTVCVQVIISPEVQRTAIKTPMVTCIPLAAK